MEEMNKYDVGIELMENHILVKKVEVVSEEGVNLVSSGTLDNKYEVIAVDPTSDIVKVKPGDLVCIKMGAPIDLNGESYEIIFQNSIVFRYLK